MEIPQNVSEEKYKKAFKDYFNKGWEEVLDAVDSSFNYNVYNSVYFSVGDIKSVENVTLDQLLDEEGLNRSCNIVVS